MATVVETVKNGHFVPCQEWGAQQSSFAVPDHLQWVVFVYKRSNIVNYFFLEGEAKATRALLAVIHFMVGLEFVAVLPIERS